MNHAYIEQNNVADLYVMGKLTPRQQALFEQHFLSCSECVELLEEIETVRQALQIASLEEMANPSTGFKSRLFFIFSRPSPWRPAVIGVALLLLIALPSGVLIEKIRRLQHELDQVKAAYVPAPEQAQNQDGTDSVGTEASQVPSRPLADQRPLDAESASRKQPRRIAGPEHTARLARPQANPPIFVLSAVSRSVEKDSEPLNEVYVDRSSKLFIFSIELETKLFEMYRATVLTSDKQALWRIDKLRPNRYGALTIAFGPKHLQEGDYLLALEGLTKEGKFVPASYYPFRVVVRNP